MKNISINIFLGKSEVSYNPSTGKFVWLKAFRKPWLRNSLATHKTSNGYLYIKANGRMHSASRLAYFLFFKIEPGNLEIDHINRIRTDNRPKNLRLVTRKQQLLNRKFPANRYGSTGVSLHKKSGLFRARHANKTTYHRTIKEASNGYRELIKKYLI